ncbi:hypothetical protein HOBO_33 [Bacillus phage Hobo]|uniref:Uncharacterized protein n=2 Tax=Caeruleovirus BM15 TaxID=1985178 RepID=A0A0S2MU84_9CAUD|nr:hypothetical protein FD732_gp033 [Bacillus phage BM15]ALO79454.1 hypothetical protein BM10_33 [Bacillus phage BM15]AXQ66814.1 hypothetical protein HOBO_33 [Bacillus phage Hobo]
MSLVRATELIEGVLEAGKMTVKVKADIQEAYDMLRVAAEEDKEKARAEELGLTPSAYDTTTLVSDIQSAINVFVTHAKTYNLAAEDVKRMNEMQLDLLHALELFDESVDDKVKYTEDLITLQRQRRQAKNFTEIATPIKMLVASNPKLAKDLQNCLKQVEQQLEVHKKRAYHPRRLTALQEAFQEAASAQNEK